MPKNFKTENSEMTINIKRDQANLGNPAQRFKLEVGNPHITPNTHLYDDELFVSDSTHYGSISKEELIKKVSALEKENEELRTANLQLQDLAHANKRMAATLALQQKEMQKLQELFLNSQKETQSNLQDLIDSRINDLLNERLKTQPQNSEMMSLEQKAVAPQKTEVKPKTYATVTKAKIPHKRKSVKEKINIAKKTIANLESTYTKSELGSISLKMLTGYDPVNNTLLHQRPPAYKRMQKNLKDYRNPTIIRQVNDSELLYIGGIKRTSYGLIKSLFENCGITKSEVKHLNFVSHKLLMIICDKSTTQKFIDLCESDPSIQYYHKDTFLPDDLITVTRNEIKKSMRLDCAVKLQSLIPNERQHEIFPDFIDTEEQQVENTITSQDDVMADN